MIVHESLSEAFIAMMGDRIGGNILMQATMVRPPISKGEVNVEEGDKRWF
jgi:hypothetical protein